MSSDHRPERLQPGRRVASRRHMATVRLWLMFAAVLIVLMPLPLRAAGLEALLSAYPGWLSRIEGNVLVWKDGTRMPLDDGRADKTLEQKLAEPDIDDMFSMPYALGRSGVPPAAGHDPGRVRYAPLFDKMYGNCRDRRIAGNLVPVIWLPSKGGQRLMFSSINGAADQLRKVSAALDRLPARYLQYLMPSAGTFNCRPIAGTRRLSAHGHGIAIDLATQHAHYWQWSTGKGSQPQWRNEIPWEIVEIFEAHGFIWGGKWYHYDTMHFEFRPELIGTGGTHSVGR